MYEDDPMMNEYREEIREESRQIPRMECDECGHVFEDGETYFDLDGYYYCDECMSNHKRTIR